MQTSLDIENNNNGLKLNGTHAKLDVPSNSIEMSPTNTSSALTGFIRTRRLRYKLANCYRKWRKTARFMLTCVLCVFCVEMVVHKGEAPFQHNINRRLNYHKQFGEVPTPRIGMSPLLMNKSGGGADDVNWPAPGIPERSDDVIIHKDDFLKNMVKDAPQFTPPKKSYVYLNESLPIDYRVQDLVSHLSVDDVIQQTIATYSKATQGIPRLGIKPFVWISECPSGITTSWSTAFTNPLAMAATFR